MKPMQSDQLVTVMGGAAAANLASWIKPLPAALGGAKQPWDVGPKAQPPGSTSWLTR